MHQDKKHKAPKVMTGVKSQHMNSINPSSGDSEALTRKFSLVPFAKEKTIKTSSENVSNMQKIQETPEENKSAPRKIAKETTFTPVNDKVDDDEDDYEDDNDFEPFETSKKDFYPPESNSSEAKYTSAEETERRTPDNHPVTQTTEMVTPPV